MTTVSRAVVEGSAGQVVDRGQCRAGDRGQVCDWKGVSSGREIFRRHS